MIYTWNILAWVRKYGPVNVFHSEVIDLLSALLQPVVTLYDAFIVFSEEIDRKSKYSSQQGVLRSLLNDLFDVTERRIRIVTLSDAIDEIYINYKAETLDEEVYIFKKTEVAEDDTFVFTKEELKGINGFEVYVPSSLQSKEGELRSWIEYYRLADKEYNIIYE